jgi:CheY-like chemotaxis protein
MKKVLIIEDDKQTQDLYRTKLEAEGYEVEVADDGKAALVAAQHKPDLIVLDLMLPGGMNGFDVLNQLKQDPELSQIKIIVLSNLSSEAETARDMGVAEYLVKANTSIQEVIDRIKKNIPNGEQKTE